MSKLPFLEDFSSAGTGAAMQPMGTDDNASELRASFDDGYKCGWQDGTAASESEEREVRDSLSSALQALNFTYFEARQHAMQSVRPVLEAMVDVVLPQLLAKSLGGRVVEVLEGVSQTIEAPVTIACAPQSEEMLNDLVGGIIKFPITVEVEPTLSTSQAILHLNDGQTRIDLDATLEALRECINTFFELPEEKEAEHA